MWITTTGCKMPETYGSAFKLPPIRTRDVHVMYPIAVTVLRTSRHECDRHNAALTTRLSKNGVVWSGNTASCHSFDFQ